MLERADPEIWADLAEEQSGIVARRQLLALGLTPAQARQRVETGRWLAVCPGVYATFTGALSDTAKVWAAILYAGPEACASHGTALWLVGAQDRPPGVIHVVVPGDRRIKAPPGIRVHSCRDYPHRKHPASTPPRTRIEEALLDAVDDETELDRVLDAVFRAIQRRLTTADRVRSALARRARHRWRALLGEVLAEVQDGVASPLEARYARDVERRHGLPRGVRNKPENKPEGGRWYRDVRYSQWATVVELDGREAHPPDQRFRDLRRDNAAVVQGEGVLRYGWRDVAGRPCAVAEQVAAVLRSRGCSVLLRPCSATCPAVPPPALGPLP